MTKAADPTYAVTGSSGRLGGRIARRLAAAGLSQTLLARTPSQAPVLPGAHACPGSYSDAGAIGAALRPTDRVLMVSAAESPDRVAQHRTFIDAAAHVGVAHLVYISFCAAAPDATFIIGRDHWHTEQYIRASGLPFTFLRDNLYADFTPALVGDDGVIRGPGGRGRAAVVAQDDIADAAVAVLTHADDHVGAVYTLTGPRALSLDDIAAILTEHSGRAITYRDETVDEAYESRAVYGAPSWQVDAWVSTYTAIAAGDFATVTDDVPRLTGRPPMPLSEVIRSQAG